MPSINFSFKKATNAQRIANGASFESGSFYFEKCTDISYGFTNSKAKSISITGTPPTNMNYLFYQDSSSNTSLGGKTLYDIFPQLNEDPYYLYNVNCLAYMFYNTKVEGDIGKYDEDGNPTTPLYIKDISSQTIVPSGLYYFSYNSYFKRIYLDVYYSAVSFSNSQKGGRCMLQNNPKLEEAKIILEKPNPTGSNEFFWGAFASNGSLKKLDLKGPLGVCESTFTNCSSLENLCIENTTPSLPGANGSFLYGCSSLKNFIYKEGSQKITSAGINVNSSVCYGNPWGGGKTYLSLKTMKNWASYFTTVTLTTIYDPVRKKSAKPEAGVCTADKLGLDISMVDDNGITCIISLSDAEEQGLEYDFVDTTNTYCVRQDSELYTALNSLREHNFIWDMVYH